MILNHGTDSQIAKEFLVDLIGIRKVRCDVKAIDLYKREVAICYAGEDELNRIMVQKGLAVAYRQYSKRYVADELKAKKEFIGIWNSAFMMPDQWRRYQKLKNHKYKNNTAY